MGRSYGGYLTLAALVTFPGLFAVGIDVCGMSNFATFYAHTEPWIAAAAVSQVRRPAADAELLRDLSPMTQIDRLTTPLLLIHGGERSNVPVIESEQVVEALAARGVPHGYLVFAGEGHDFLARDNAEGRPGHGHHRLADPAPRRDRERRRLRRDPAPVEVAAQDERLAADLGRWLTEVTFVDLDTDEVTARVIDSVVRWAEAQGWRVYRRAPSVLPLPPPLEQRHSVLDVACARPTVRPSWWRSTTPTGPVRCRSCARRRTPAGSRSGCGGASGVSPRRPRRCGW